MDEDLEIFFGEGANTFTLVILNGVKNLLKVQCGHARSLCMLKKILHCVQNDNRK